MPQTQIACPRCKQPITANLEQLFDVSADPSAKQRLLSGASNLARCPHCGFEGRLATPIVYHDADKELLLTFFPSELGMPVTEQERLVGPMITQVTNRLPAEKRRAYLFKPVANLTYDSLIETILGKDGITPEMIKAQRDRANLINRLVGASARDVRTQLIQENKALIDEQFFVLFSRLLQDGLASGQEDLTKQLGELQNQLLEETDIGRQIKETSDELQAATKALQEAGSSLTREKLLDLIIAAPNDARLKAFATLAHSGLDYVFFQTLTERADKATGEERAKLEALREKLLGYVGDIDKQLEARQKQAQALIDKILAEPDVAKATQANLASFTQDAVDLVQGLHRQASEKNDYAQMGKLQKMLEVLQAASAPPPEVALIEQLLETPDEALEQTLAANEALINDALIESLNGLVSQLSAQAEQGNAEAVKLAPRLQAIYKAALKISMKKKMTA